jgi:hypothetical protein
VAAKEGVKLIIIQDIADPLALVIKELLRARRPELLTRLFQELLPDAAVRSYSYTEYAGVFDRGIPSSVSFSVEVVFTGDTAKYFEDVLELFSAIASKTSDLGMYISLKSTSDPRWKEHKVVLELGTDLTQIIASNKIRQAASASIRLWLSPATPESRLMLPPLPTASPDTSHQAKSLLGRGQGIGLPPTKTRIKRNPS